MTSNKILCTLLPLVLILGVLDVQKVFSQEESRVYICRTTKSTSISIAEQNKFPGNKTLYLYKIDPKDSTKSTKLPVAIVNSDADGNVVLTPKVEPLKIGEFTAKHASTYWGPIRNIVHCTEYANLRNLTPPKYGIWKWFQQSKDTWFARYYLTTSERQGVLIEAFFINSTPSEGLFSSRLLKYRILLLGVGSSDWLENEITTQHKNLQPVQRNSASKETSSNFHASEDWSIHLAYAKDQIDPLATTECRTRSKYDGKIWKGTENIHFLKKAGEGRCVAVIQIKENGESILNPKYKQNGFEIDYGPIPETSQMTKQDINKLWGKSSSSQDGIVTYKFFTIRKSGDSKRLSVFVDLVFSESKIQKYRIRTESITNAKWMLSPAA